MGKDTQTVVDRIIKTILAGIENGTFPQGSALPAQRQLAEYFDVSRNVIREAVKSLEGSGVLYSKQGSGIYVKSAVPTPVEHEKIQGGSYTLQQILDLCRIIWHSSMFSVVKYASSQDLERLKKANEKILKEYQTVTVHQKFIYESSFGMNICQLSENPLANDLMRELLKATTDIDYKIIVNPNYRLVLEIDASIIEALISRDRYRAYFLANERDIEIDKLIVEYKEILDKTYTLYIRQ